MSCKNMFEVNVVALTTAQEVEFFCGCWLANVASSRNLLFYHLLKPALPQIGWTTIPIATRGGKGREEVFFLASYPKHCRLRSCFRKS